MSRYLSCALLCAVLGCLYFPSHVRAQSANGSNKAWQVRYHKTNGNPRSNDIAVRLKIRPGTGNQLTATLTRFDKTTGGGTSEKYDKRSGAAGSVELNGLITNNAGGGSARKREDFVLAGIYFDDGGALRVVTVRGFHHTGKSKTSRSDDQLCVRIIEKGLASRDGMLVAPAPGEPCDEQPPDEDVLTEEDVPDPAPTTPSPDPDYDGGP